jgi:hypothetical protein
MLDSLCDRVLTMTNGVLPTTDRAPTRSIRTNADMARNLGLDDVVDHFTLVVDGGLGFTVLLKFVLWRGAMAELPDDAVAHLARQVRVPASELGSFDFGGRTAKRHRTEIRAYTGFRACSVIDAETLVAWLTEHIAGVERGRTAFARSCWRARIARA